MNYFIVVQLQWSAFSPHHSPLPQPNPPPSLASTLPIGFVHVSFKNRWLFLVLMKNCIKLNEQMEDDFDTIVRNGEENTDQVWIPSSAKTKVRTGLR